MEKKDASGKVDDEVVECLSTLFTTAGKNLQEYCVGEEPKKRCFDSCWNDFKSLASGKSLSVLKLTKLIHSDEAL